MGRGRDTAGSGATRGDGRNGTHLEGGGDTAGDERGARDLSMRPVRLAICERPLRGDRSTRFILPMNVVVSRLVKSHLASVSSCATFGRVREARTSTLYASRPSRGSP